MDDDTTVRPHPEVVFTPLRGEEAALLDLRTKAYFSLNETGRRIWELLPDHPTVSSIVSALAEEYEGETDELAQAVRELLERLRAEDLLAT